MAQTTLRFVSPLAMKRIIFFSLRKQMIGRRAYSDSIRSKKGNYDESRQSNAQQNQTQKESLSVQEPQFNS